MIYFEPNRELDVLRFMRHLIVLYLFVFSSAFNDSDKTFLLSEVNEVSYCNNIIGCPKADSISFFPQNNLIITGKPNLIKSYRSRGLYTVLPDSILFGSIPINKCGVVFIYGSKKLIENSNTFSLYMNYYETMDTAVTHYIPRLYYTVIDTKNESDLVIENCDEINSRKLRNHMLYQVSVKKFKRNKIEKKVTRWKKFNCR